MFDLNKFENNTAVITDCGEQLTYAELASVANEFAAAVSQKGLLFCLCENHIGSLVGYVACMEHHIPIVLLDGSKDDHLPAGIYLDLNRQDRKHRR